MQETRKTRSKKTRRGADALGSQNPFLPLRFHIMVLRGHRKFAWLRNPTHFGVWALFHGCWWDFSSSASRTRCGFDRCGGGGGGFGHSSTYAGPRRGGSHSPRRAKQGAVGCFQRHGIDSPPL